MIGNVRNTIGLAVGVALLLFMVGVVRNGNLDYWYMPYNLILGSLPLVLALGVRRLITRYAWKDWRPLAMLFVWLLFLPNSFYLVTDFIHLFETPRVDIIQDIVMLAQFSVLGFVFGFASLYILHKVYEKYVLKVQLWLGVGVALLLSSFAIYLGRVLRWNSWDVLVNPLGLGHDVGDILLRPLAHIDAFSTTISFFAMLASLYLLVWVILNSTTYVKR